MARVEFRLSLDAGRVDSVGVLRQRLALVGVLPIPNSWNGKWSGQDRNYTLDRDLDDERAIQISGQSWSYSWPDGWRAEISARIVPAGEERKPSHGFYGYDWMITSILRYGKIYADHEVPTVSDPSA